MNFSWIVLVVLISLAVVGYNMEKRDAEARASLLNDQEKNVLDRALQTEYKAMVMYQKVLEKFKGISPFSGISVAKKKHVQSLLQLYNMYGVDEPVPEPITFDPSLTFKEYCDIALSNELNTIDTYEGLFVEISNPEIIRSLEDIQGNIKFNHVPAFQKCAE